MHAVLLSAHTAAQWYEKTPQETRKMILPLCWDCAGQHFLAHPNVNGVNGPLDKQVAFMPSLPSCIAIGYTTVYCTKRKIIITKRNLSSGYRCLENASSPSCHWPLQNTEKALI